jgi:hypothetical protein
MIPFLRRLLLDDSGRKLLALLFALVLFDLLDAKVRGSDRLTVHVVYVDAAALTQVAEAPDRTSKLMVVERLDPEAPLVVADRPRPEFMTLLLDGPKDALERVKARRRTLHLRVSKEGELVPSVEDLEEIGTLREELGPGGSIRIDPPFRLRVEPEARHSITIGDDDLVLVGSPAPGFDPRSRSTVVRPPELLLVGPRGAVDRAVRQRGELFERIVLDGQRQVTQSVGLALGWRDQIRLMGQSGEEIQGLRVTLDFKRQMEAVRPPDGEFELEVRVLCDDDALARKDPARRWADGWRLRFPGRAAAPRLRLQFLAPAPGARPPEVDRLALELARDHVDLVVRAHQLAGLERGTLGVAIVKYRDFPEDLDVVVAPGEADALEVEWVAPAREEGDGAREKGAGNDE